MTTYKTITVASELLFASDRNTWKLADAILADVPNRPEGRPRNLPLAGEVSEESSIEDLLADIVAEMDDLGITTPNGDPYTTASLANMRHTAMAWPLAERHDEAAYRTHQEAGGRDGLGRKMLAALCKVAQGKRVVCPDEVDPDAWATAKKRVLDKKGKPRPPKLLVSANDLRTAMKRKINTPPPNFTDDVQGLLYHLSNAAAALRSFSIRFAVGGDLANDHLEDDDRKALSAALTEIIDSAALARDVVNAVASEEALQKLLDDEAAVDDTTEDPDQ